jgi:hypothetical protein
MRIANRTREALSGATERIGSAEWGSFANGGNKNQAQRLRLLVARQETTTQGGLLTCLALCDSAEWCAYTALVAGTIAL